MSAIVLDQDAQGRPVDPIAVAHALEREVRQPLEHPPIDVRMIGFAKVMGDIADGAASVVMFAVITLVLTLLAVRIYCQSWRIAFVPVLCSVVAVIWQLGALVVLRYGIDPIGLLVPFLIFAIGVSHGVQKISAAADAAFDGLDSKAAARRTFRQLLVPAVVALLADLVGFVSILLIPVQVIREMAITASIGVAIVILTDLVLLPVLVSYVHFDAGYQRPRGAAPAAARGAVAAPLRTHLPRSGARHHRDRGAARSARAGGRDGRPRSGTRRRECRSCAPTRATTATTTSSRASSR